MARNYAALLHEYLEEWESLNEAEVGRLVLALLKYSAKGEIVELKGNERILFPRVRAQEDRFQASYDGTSEKRSEAGKKGAATRWQTMANDGKAMANDGKAIASYGKNGNTETETETKTKTETPPSIDGRSKGETRPRFVPPTVDEVRGYCRERGNTVDPERFVAYYEANGWRVGKNPMRDWKAAVRTWERNGYDAPKRNGKAENEGSFLDRYREALKHDEN